MSHSYRFHSVSLWRILPNACQPVPGSSNGKALSVSSAGNREFFISTNLPLKILCKKKLKELPIRSLSNEVSPSKDSPIIFSDEMYMVLSFSFHLQDVYARGQKRLYSIVVVSEVESLITSKVSCIMGYVSKIVEKLQTSAEQTFSKIAAELGLPTTSRLNYPALPPQTNAGLPSNLSDVVGDPKIFQKLHLQFCRILDEICHNIVDTSKEGVCELNERDFDQMKSLLLKIGSPKFASLLFLILSHTGPMERVLFDSTAYTFAVWPEKLVCSLTGIPPGHMRSAEKMLLLRSDALTDELAGFPIKESLFASRLSHILTIDNSSTIITTLQIRVLSNQIQSLLGTCVACEGRDFSKDAGLKPGDIDIIRALSKRLGPEEGDRR